ncbi:hypothetical protein GQ600_8006 [Phytophthora cactorum]|nr:hypothetical protein GQ600_8006 [Phytophthora cactorum]
MNEEDDADILLLLCAANTKRNASLIDVRREVHQAMVEKVWRTAMRARHYLTAQCLDTPCAITTKLSVLFLCFYVGSMENGTLCMLFGVPPSTLSRTLRKAEEALSRSLDGLLNGEWAASRKSIAAELAVAYDPTIRGLRLANLFRMANYRVRTVGISQIRTTFTGAMEKPM